jgi:hypothetical protein
MAEETDRSVATESEVDEPESDDEDAPTELPTQTIFRVLTDARRRYVMHHLKQVGEAVAVGDLAEQVAAWENDKEVEAITSQERKRVYVSLYQSHLPTMAEEGIVRYDQNRGEVELTDAAAAVDVYMEIVPRRDIPWRTFYLGLTAASALVLGLVWMDVRPFTSVPDLGWAAVILVSFGVTALVESYASRRMQFGDAGPPPELRE